jgi:hypothetical protein
MPNDHFSKENHLLNVGRDFMIQAAEALEARGENVDIGPVWPPDSSDNIRAALVGLYRAQKPPKPGQP